MKMSNINKVSTFLSNMSKVSTCYASNCSEIRVSSVTVTFASLNFSCEPALDIFCYIFLKVNTRAHIMSEYFSIS